MIRIESEILKKNENRENFSANGKECFSVVERLCSRKSNFLIDGTKFNLTFNFSYSSSSPFVRVFCFFSVSFNLEKDLLS